MLFVLCLVYPHRKKLKVRHGQAEGEGKGKEPKINYIIFFKDIYKNEKGKINISGY